MRTKRIKIYEFNELCEASQLTAIRQYALKTKGLAGTYLIDGDTIKDELVSKEYEFTKDGSVFNL